MNILDTQDDFESLPKEGWDEIERRFYAADKEVVGCLARFIREHRGEYQTLLARKATERT